MITGIVNVLTDVGWRLQHAVVWLLAQAGDAGATPEQGAADRPAVNPLIDFLTQPLNLILISAILFMLIVARPQQKQLKAHQLALAGLKKNDRVITASGVHGVVVQANPGEGVVILRIDENSGARMTINRESVAKIIPDDSKE